MKHITLQIAASDTHCGECPHLRGAEYGYSEGETCAEFGGIIVDGGRRADCLAAEASHAALIRDAEAWRRVRSAVLTADRQRSIATIVTGELER